MLLIVGSLALTAHAQDCTPEDMAKRPGMFEAGKAWGASTQNVAHADLIRERATLLNIHKMIASGVKPTGAVGRFSYSFDGGIDMAGKNKVADVFGYSIYMLNYICDRGSTDKSEFRISMETSNILNIEANAINEFGLRATDISDNTFRGYLLMKNKPQIINGFYFLGDQFSGDDQSRRKAYTWLITYDDTLPFSYVSRKEYLLLSKDRLQKTIQENGNGSGYYNEFVNRINEYLNQPDSELSQPAIVYRNDEERFTGFKQEGSSGSYFLIKHNPAYYRKGLPKSTAQFFTVVFKVLEGNEFPVYEENMKAIKKTVDFRARRNMLGK